MNLDVNFASRQGRKENFKTLKKIIRILDIFVSLTRGIFDTPQLGDFKGLYSTWGREALPLRRCEISEKRKNTSLTRK